MKGLFIPEITAEMFRNGCLESIEALMAEGEVYDIEYDPKSAQPERKKGLWLVETKTDIKSGTNAISGYKCNICGYFVPWDFTHKSPFFIEEYNFCPHCGADTRRKFE